MKALLLLLVAFAAGAAAAPARDGGGESLDPAAAAASAAAADNLIAAFRTGMLKAAAFNSTTSSPPLTPSPRDVLWRDAATGLEYAAQRARDARRHPLESVDFARFTATMAELVLPKGYPLEAYDVTTPDGYILTMYRIPYGKYRNVKDDAATARRDGGPNRRPPVLLHHGVTLASNCWTVLNANESAAFVLADAGFDVWMANSRGNTYSRRHVTLSTYESAFWEGISIDTIATVDLIDFMLALTGAKRTAYIGHSQGCTLIQLLLADLPQYNDRISVATHLGPVMAVELFRAPFLRNAASRSLDQLLKNLGIGEFMANRVVIPPIQTLCVEYPLDELCSQLISYIFYGPSQFITPDDYGIISRTWPSSVSTRNLEQWAQIFRTPGFVFTKYDYGTDCNVRDAFGHRVAFYESCNQEKYGGALRPPAYNLSRVTAPQVFFTGEVDLMSVPPDVAQQRAALRGAVVHEVLLAQYAHMDFPWDRNAKHKTDMVDVLFRYAPRTYGSA